MEEIFIFNIDKVQDNKIEYLFCCDLSLNVERHLSPQNHLLKMITLSRILL